MFDRRRGGLAWVCALQFFALEVFAAAAVPGYSYARDYISDLGAPSLSPRYLWMNASFVLQAGLILAGLAGGLARGRAAKAALALCALGAALVGLAPEDVAPGWHYTGAALNLLGCNLGMMFTGRRAGLAAGGVGLAACAALGAHAYAALGVGTVERLAAYPFVLWLAFEGTAALRGDGGPTASRARDPRA